MYEAIDFVSAAKLTVTDSEAVLDGNATRLRKLKSKRWAQAKGKGPGNVPIGTKCVTSPLSSLQ